MKKYFLLTFLSVLFKITMAQYSGAGQKVYIRYVGGPLAEVSFINEKLSYIVGGEAYLFFNDRITFGIYAKTKLDFTKTSTTENSTNNIKFLQTGCFIGAYLYKEPQIIDPVVVLQLGPGVIKQWPNGASDLVFSLTPNILAERRITRYILLGLGINYRLVLAVNDSYKGQGYSGLGAAFHIKVSVN